MRTFVSANSLWEAAIRDCLAAGAWRGSRVGDCREVIGWAGALHGVGSSFVTNPAREMSPHFAAAELLWFLAGSNDPAWMTPFAPSYADKYADGGVVVGGYGGRLGALGAGGQLDRAASLLRNHPGTRRCVVPLWDKADLRLADDPAAPKDLPCAVALEFLLREDGLHMVAMIRSNDVWLGMPYDVHTFATLQRLVAACVGVRPATYTHMVGSLHLYDRHERRAEAALGVDWPSSELGYPEDPAETAQWPRQAVEAAASQAYRISQGSSLLGSDARLNSPFADADLLAAAWLAGEGTARNELEDMVHAAPLREAARAAARKRGAR